MVEDMELKDGDKVAVLGAGPAGSFFAIQLIKMAREKGKDLEVALFDRKFFSGHGPRGCNMCAGVIGADMVSHLKRLDMLLPQDVIRQSISGYNFHTRGESVCIEEAKESKMYTVYRGAGPVSPLGVTKKGFDQFLLEYAVKLGAKFYNNLVEDIIMHGAQGSDEGPIAIVYGEKKDSYPASLVVGAFGVNSRLSEKIAFGYRPPHIWQTCQAEIPLKGEESRRKVGDYIHVFISGNPLIMFTALTPKGDLLTITGIGRHVRIKDLKEEIDSTEISNYLPKQWEISCHCHPRLPVSTGGTPYRSRFVIVGDAFISRYLKNGIESAYHTATLAAKTAIDVGVSSDAFRRYYYSGCISRFHYDNFCGKLLFGIHPFIASSSILSRTHMAVVREEQEMGPSGDKRLSHILWNLFTGDAPYKSILIQCLSPKLQLKLTLTTLSLLIKTARQFLARTKLKLQTKI